MPTENRDIYFSENEVKIALMQFSARKGLNFKVENITGFNMINKETVSIELKVFDAQSGKTGTVKYGHPEIAAALMRYCMFLKIPLPKAGKKSLQSSKNGVFLNIKIL
ncbi:MAG: hypothetical protein H6912_05880 [Kordiimonadaceae bacterium]|nr:hypothetical protein [Kordiimonadaceae bacterium]